LPIPGAGTVVASLVLFYSDVWGSPGGKNYIFLFLPFLLAVLMVSTMRFHALKEINFKERKPFWLLVVIGAAFVLIFMYPEIVIFIFSIIYVLWGIIEGAYLFNRKMKLKKTI
jgi:CDP-diacylglycerol--serine O-phosphatidyltransferase